MPKKHRVFVYGTLRPGLGQTVVVPGTIYDLGWFPGIVMDGGETVCEVIEVTDAELSRLDGYEGYDVRWPEESLYLRQKYQDGFIYVYNRDIGDRPKVEGGDWLKYRQEDAGSNHSLAQGIN